MKRLSITGMLLLALLPLWTAGQGIEFRDMPLEKALETAAKEKKISYVEEALRYIENNYAHTVNIQVIADYLSIERTYLYRLFKDITGSSPQEYLLDYRIRRACSLLKETDLPVSDIARSVGYNDALYFSRLFKQKKGRTPTRYREENHFDKI